MFDPSIIFHRTQAGREEIKQKSHGLTQSERLVLIMVDGVSTFEQVRNKLPVLAEGRFTRAVQKLQSKELILEVFLPVEGQAPEEIERTVIDRFLEQDPLDPVTIIMRDPEEELEFLARFSTASTARPAASTVAEPVVTTAAPAARPALDARPQAEPVPLVDSDEDELHTELINQLANELKERQQSRPPRTEKSGVSSGGGSESRKSSREGRPRSHEVGTSKQSSSQWGYWLIAVGFAFIAGYFLARMGG